MSDGEWARLIDVNLSGTFYCLRAEMRHMIERGGGGAIVNVASSAAVLALEGFASYVASKKGLLGLTEVAALEGGRHQIRVNTVIPANVVGTKMFDDMLGSGPEAERIFGANSPLERPARPIDIANACFWVCSDEANYMSGTSLLIDGATTIRHPSSRKHA
jgi:NAD(P)-dependent dehydrogenase (short-subunit alcohol dehydrogenase family)